MENEFFFYLAVFLAASLLFARWLKKKHGTEVFLGIVSLIRTQKANDHFERFARWGKPLDVFSDLAVVLGFGSIAVDFVWGRKLPLGKRIALFAGSFAVLTALSYAIFGSFLKSSVITGGQEWAFSIAFGLAGFAGFSVLAIVSQGIHIIEKLLEGKKPLPGVAPVIPGVEIPNVPLYVPLHGWISFLIILVLHEGFHGVIARREKLRVKSAGLLLFGFLPIGAFVEPDDEELKRSSDRVKLRVFASGAAANLAFVVVLLSILVVVWGFLLSPLVMPSLNQLRQESVLGVQIDGVSQYTEFEGDRYDNSAYGVLERGMRVLKANGVPVKTIPEFQQQLALSGSSVSLTVDRLDGSAFEQSFEKNALGRIGVTVSEIPDPSFSPPWHYEPSIALLGFLQSFFQWLLLLSFLVGFVNFLPMNPFDGGKIASTILPSYFAFTNWPKEVIEKRVTAALFYAILLVLFVNAMPLFIP